MSDRTRRPAGRRVILITAVVASGLLFVSGCGSRADPDALATQSDTVAVPLSGETAPPDTPVRLIFIHHSTGENWLSDENGGLGRALRGSNWFVSDTNYGWGPDAIGDNTDIGHWWLWFRGPDSARYLDALYSEDGQNCGYSRLSISPGGPNEVVVFKSCFPNSALQGAPGDPVPAISTNPLRGEGSGSDAHTVADAKGIYIDLLEYFRTRQDRLFVVITAPPLADPTYAANARAFNDWLVDEWLQGYSHRNVVVFDFYNVLTTNGGDPDTDDLERETGNHHRWWQDSVQHKTNGDNDGSPNVLEYPSGDDHPSQAGNRKATAEFVPLLNRAYRIWKGSSPPPTSTTTEPPATTTTTLVEPPETFTDVPSDHPCYTAIMGMLDSGVIKGYAAEGAWEFRPDNPVWRAQFAKMICGALHVPVEPSLTAPFTDLGQDDPFDLYPHQYIAAAAAQGITNGTGGGLFSPYSDISRAQVISMVVRASNGLEPERLAEPLLDFTCSLPRLQPRALAEPARGRVQRPSGSPRGVRCGLGPVGVGHARRSGTDTLGPGLGRLACRPSALRGRTCAENGLRTDTPLPAGRSPAAGHSQE